MHKNFKKQLTINLIIAAGILAVLLIIFIWLRFDISRRAETIKESRKELAFRFSAIEKAATLKKDRETAAEQKIILEELLPEPERLINFSKEVTNLAKKNNMNLDFSYGQEISADKDEPGYISFIITANATFPNWLNFIKAMETMPYFISLESFNLVADEDEYRSIINGKVFSR